MHESVAMRRQQVWRLHFMRGVSSIDVADILDVHRRTIQQDIREIRKDWQNYG